jgi:hypothetical protein
MDKLAEGGHAEVYQGKLLTIHASIERLMATKLKSFFCLMPRIGAPIR